MLLDLFLILVGIVLLYLGGETLVSGVTDLAATLRVSPFVVAFTVVAFGTSAPELAASGAAAWEGLSEIALGNIVGSNIANIGLILGCSALVASLGLDRALFRREGPFMLATAVVLVLLTWLSAFERGPALLLLAGLGVFLYVLIGEGRAPELHEDSDAAVGGRPLWMSSLFVLAGLLLLVGGAKLLVDSASALARAAGIPESVIGLTMVAFGTSVPELASCLVAARRREGSIILGNVIGSNIFNTLLILPAVILIRPFDADWGAWSAHVLVMLGYSILMALLFVGSRLTRIHGAFLVASYLAYIGWIAFTSTGS